ncbi:MAG: ABC transporter ATP-binding protein [Proteobacteria bacterium]|nr:ABC transporter ATP-binding protein [Pseudomonadota bacterium]
MAKIEFRDIAHTYASGKEVETADYALHRMNQTWDDGKAYALLGPSGCGKTTLLNVISGLLTPKEGQVHFDGRDVTTLSPEERNVAQVFQFPVVYDTMSVYDNLAFPLKNRGFNSNEIPGIVNSVAEVLDVESMLRKRASGLNAEDKQKISLGRALVRSDVSAILFDEALTMIDPHQKWLLRRKLKEIHQKFDHTMIYVTHDQSEALTFADEIVVMDEGRILQVGKPEELFERPAHKFIGYFIGSPGMNFLPCKLEGKKLWFQNFSININDFEPEKIKQNDKLEIGIRPVYLELHDTANEDRIEIEIEQVHEMAWAKHVQVNLKGHTLHVKVPEDQPINEKNRFLSFHPENVRVYANEHLIH